MSSSIWKRGPALETETFDHWRGALVCELGVVHQTPPETLALTPWSPSSLRSQPIFIEILSKDGTVLGDEMKHSSHHLGVCHGKCMIWSPLIHQAHTGMVSVFISEGMDLAFFYEDNIGFLGTQNWTAMATSSCMTSVRHWVRVRWQPSRARPPLYI